MDGGINPYVYSDDNPINIFDPNGLKASCYFLFSLPDRWDYRVREKWVKEGKWKLRSSPSDGGGWKRGLPWRATICICEKTRTGKRRTELRMSWIDTYLCKDGCHWWYVQQERWSTLWKKTEKIYNTQTEMLAGGLFPNQTSAWISCRTQCQNLNFTK